MDYPLDTGCGCASRIHGCGCDQHPWISIQCHHWADSRPWSSSGASSHDENYNERDVAISFQNELPNIELRLLFCSRADDIEGQK